MYYSIATAHSAGPAIWDECGMLYAIGCVSCGLLVQLWGNIGRTLGPLGSTLDKYWAMSWQCWDHFGRSWGYLGTHSGLGFRVWGLITTTHTPFEMPKSLSTYACAAKTLAWKTKMFSSIEVTYLRNTPNSLSHYTCAAKSSSGHVGDGKYVIADSQNHWQT